MPEPESPATAISSDELAYLQHAFRRANEAAQRTPEALAHAQYVAYLRDRYGLAPTDRLSLADGGITRNAIDAAGRC
jgi:hypothetical protein